MTARSLDAVAQELYGVYYVNLEYPFKYGTEVPESGIGFYEVKGIAEAQATRKDLVIEAISLCEEELACLRDLLKLLREPK